MKRIVRAVLPAFLLAVSVGQIYAFTMFSDEIAKSTGHPLEDVQFAFSLGIFFLGMGAAFFGKVVEKSLRVSMVVGTALFVGGLCATGMGIAHKSLALIYFGYGFLVGTGTGIIYISPVKTMMLWFPKHKAIASAVPIISFGLGSTLSTMLYKGFGSGDAHASIALVYRGLYSVMDVATNPSAISRVFFALAAFYAVLMSLALFLISGPKSGALTAGHAASRPVFCYRRMARDPLFLRLWLFMFLNISAGLCLIPLAKQMMNCPTVGYSEGFATTVVALSGVMNGGGRFLFAWWSDRLARRVNILLVILAVSAGVMTVSFWPPLVGLALLVVNACYGAGFSVMPAILADHYGMSDISKIFGAVLSAWGIAGLVGNQAAIAVAKAFGGYGQGGHGYAAVCAMLVLAYALNFFNVLALRRSSAKPRHAPSGDAPRDGSPQ